MLGVLNKHCLLTVFIISEILNCRRLKNLFYASSPQLKGQLTRNLVGSVRVTCRSIIAKIVQIGNKMAAMSAVLKIYLEYFLLTQRPVDMKFDRNI